MANQIIKNLITYLILISIFITGDGFGGFGFKIYWYYPFYILFATYGLVAFHRFDVKILWTFLALVIYSYLANTGSPLGGSLLVLKQVVNIGFSFIVFYYFILHENFDLIGLFRKYITVSKIVVLIGLIQVALFLFDHGDWFMAPFPFLSTFPVSYRLQSVTQEPSFFAYTLAPVCFLAVYNLFHRENNLISRRWSWLFLIAYALTLSSIAYIGLILMLILLYLKDFNYRKLRYALFAITGIALLAFLAYRSISFIKMRVDDTIVGLSRDFSQEETYTGVNLSTYAMLSNVYVTEKAVREQPLIGNGLGTYELVYDHYLPLEMQRYSSLNRQDANSLALRLLTETGVIGLLLFCYFVFHFRLRGKDLFLPEHNIYWILSNGIFVLVLLWLLRTGNYAVHGKVLFLFVYYFVYREVKNAASPVTEAYQGA